MPWHARVAGIIEAWYPGQRSGAAIAKTLYGDVDPSGRLPVTFPAISSQGPTANNAGRYPGVDNLVRYSEGLFVGYRYYDRYHQTALFPFGYGLSYTRFKLSDLRIVRRGRRTFDARVKARDTGRRSGAEVIQLYIKFPSRTGEPPRQLKAFSKISLKPGRTGVSSLEFHASSFRVFDAQTNRWRTPPGTYQILVGTSSRHLPLRTQIKIR
jgi:beta-glucosidase